MAREHRSFARRRHLDRPYRLHHCCHEACTGICLMCQVGERGYALRRTGLPMVLAICATIVTHPVCAAAPPPEAEIEKSVNGGTFKGPLPPPEELATASELPLLTDLMRRLALVRADNAAGLTAALDETLSRIKEPTKLRGLVQFLRAQSLTGESKEAAAVEAIEESIRLLPGYSAPLFVAASVYAYSDRPQQAADYLIRASMDDPVSARTVRPYEVWNILRRLEAIGDRRRLGALSERLIEINWSAGSLRTRSVLARNAIDLRIGKGDVSGAKKLVPKLLLPEHSRELLSGLVYEPVWRDIEQWAGPMLDRQWNIYLREARSRWGASKDREALSDYVDALVAAGHDATLLREVLPIFKGPLDEQEDINLVFEISKVAAALGRQGRWAEADALFVHAQQAWPLDSKAIALNVAANRARYLMLAGKFDQAFDRISESIAQARKWGPEVNQDALAAMHYVRACSLHRLGRGKESGISIALAASAEITTVTALHMCLGDRNSALKALIAALESEGRRPAVIGFVQKLDQEPFDSEFGREMFRESQALREDPELLQAVSKYGRVLAYPVSDGAPPE